MDEALEGRDGRRQVTQPMLREREPLERHGVGRIALQVLAQLGSRLGHATRLQVVVGRREQVVRHHHPCRSPRSTDINGGGDATKAEAAIPANAQAVIPANAEAVIPANAGIQP
jgi:hypothetical protein